MPELPEVEHAARSLGAQILGRRIIAVTKLDWERMVETPAVDQFLDLIKGREVRAVGRRAKWIVVTLDGGWTLALHLRMSGSITVHDSAAQPDIYTHLVLLLDDGRQVFFHDTRKFGRARLLDDAGLAALDIAHGVEPLTDTFTPDLLGALLRRRHTRLKPLLLDQRVKYGGSTLRDYRNGYGEAGSNQEHFNVYDQQGKPCPRCGTPIEKTMIGQRGTHFCPFCQPIVRTLER